MNGRTSAYDGFRHNMGTILALVLSLALFLTAIVWSFDIPVSRNTSEVGPRFFPLSGAFGGLIFCGLLLRQLLRRNAEPRTEQRIPPVTIAAIILIISYVFLMRQVGFYLASIIVIPLLMMNGGERRWIILLLAVSGLCVFTYFFFEVSLNIVFPAGWWSD